MSVTTRSDTKIDEAKEHIKNAYKCLIEAVDTDTWGANEYNEEYLKTIEILILTLMEGRRKI
jgi:hypothetical protein